jgi:hypothetical protein
MLEIHLNRCRECKQRLDQMQSVIDLVGMLKEEELPDGFSQRLHLRLESEQINEITYKGQHRFSYWIKWVGVAAAIAVIIISIRVLSLVGMEDITIKERGYKSQSDSAASEDIYKRALKEGLIAGDSTESSQAPAIENNAQQEQVDCEEDVQANGDQNKKPDVPQKVNEDTGLQAEHPGEQDSTGYIKSDVVELRVQDVCITPETLRIRAIQHGIDVIGVSENDITLRITTIKQRKILYQELELLGVVRDIGTDFNSDTVSVIIVQDE